MSREQVVAKSRDLMAPVLGTAQTAQLIDRLLEMEKIQDIRTLRPLLQVSSRTGPPRLSEYPSAK